MSTEEKVKAQHVEKVTVLTALQQSAVGKKWTREGDKFVEVRLDKETFWKAETRRVNSLSDAVALLKAKARDPRNILVHGVPYDGVDKGSMFRRNSTLAPADHRLLILDLDRINTKEMDPRAAALAAVAQLPEQFQGAKCYYQATASHGIKGARVRLFFWADQPISLAAMKTWLPKSLGTDPAIWSASQPVYLGAQVEGDPFEGKRWGKIDGAHAVAVPAEIAAIKSAVVHYERLTAASENVEIDAPHMVAEWARVTCARDDNDVHHRKDHAGRHNSIRLAAQDGKDRALTPETLEPLLSLWIAPDDEDTHAEAVARLIEIDADPAIADQIAEAGSKIDWALGDPMEADAVPLQIKSGFSSSTCAFGAAYKPDHTRHLAVRADDDDTASFDLVERARTQLDVQGKIDGATVFGLIDAMRQDGVTSKDSSDFGRDVAGLTENDNVLGDADELFDKIAKAAADAKWTQENAAKPKELFALADDLADNFRPMEYSVRGLLPRRGVGFIVGPSHGGKSFVVLDLAGHIATGKDWLGYKIKQPFCVLYVTGEGREGVDQRVRAWKLKNGSFDGNFAVMENPPNLFTDKTAADKIVKAAKALAKRTGLECALVIFDTIASLCAGMEENSAKEVGVLTQTMRTIAAKADAAVMGVHHTGLIDKGRARGSTALFGNVDFELILEAEQDKSTGRAKSRKIRNTKNRDGELNAMGHAFTLERVQVGEYPDDKEPIFSLVFTPAVGVSLAADEDEQDEAADLGATFGQADEEGNATEKPLSLTARQIRFLEVARDMGGTFLKGDFITAYNRRFKGEDDMSDDKFQREATKMRGSYLELDKTGRTKDWRWRVLGEDGDVIV